MTISKRALCAATLAATLSYSDMVVVEARAQAGATRFDLPAQDLASTLRAIARQGGREILFADEEVRGKRSGTIRGIYTVEQAVRLAIGEELLVGEESGAIVIRERPGKGGGASAQEEKSDAITVTGSRIRGAEGPSPVIIVSRWGLEEQGIPDMASVSRILPQNFTGGQNPGVAGGGDQGGYNNANNATTLNLRGLGSDATLTLINGRRLRAKACAGHLAAHPAAERQFAPDRQRAGDRCLGLCRPAGQGGLPHLDAAQGDRAVDPARRGLGADDFR
ncbi:outer membrane receptor protein involved in Fe transport [Sphingomonas trueperi]